MAYEKQSPPHAQLVGTPLEHLALVRKINRLLHFRYTHTRYDREGEILSHDTGPISGHTAKSVKHTLVKRFHLQAGGSWTCLPNGTHKRSYRCPHTGERNSISLEPIPKP